MQGCKNSIYSADTFITRAESWNLVADLRCIWLHCDTICTHIWSRTWRLFRILSDTITLFDTYEYIINKTMVYYMRIIFATTGVSKYFINHYSWTWCVTQLQLKTCKNIQYKYICTKFHIKHSANTYHILLKVSCTLNANGLNGLTAFIKRQQSSNCTL